MKTTSMAAMRDVVVFLGPSLPVEEARRRIAAIFRPPCRMGDVLDATLAGARAIVIIDGLFESTPAVWHKEILYALHCGLPVFGGSSMGALRAVELQAFGMIGVGKIFRDFEAGLLEDDDEVAVAHAAEEFGFGCKSEAMVNIRHGLACARDAGVIAEETRLALCAAAKALHFPQRSWARLLAAARESLLPAGELDGLAGFLDAEKPDLKRDDAIATLEAASRWLAANGDACATRPSTFAFEPSKYWDRLHARQRGIRRGDRALVDHVRVTHADRLRINERAALLALARRQAQAGELPAFDARVAQERFRRERGLETAAALRQWLSDQQVAPADLQGLVESEHRVRQVIEGLGSELDRDLIEVLAMEGRAGAARRALGQREALLAAKEIDDPRLNEVADVQAMWRWYQAQQGIIRTSAAEHALEMGFDSLRSLERVLLREFLAWQAQEGPATPSS